MQRTLVLLLLALIVPLRTQSHIGNPAVTFEGKAGPYNVTVLVTPPDVIPGTATVDIYLAANNIESIFAKPVYWYAGDEGTPEADAMLPVPGEPGHYQGLIWLMNSGTSGIDIAVKGDAGEGRILVPVMAVSTAQREMPASLGYVLSALGVLLVVLMITIIGASSSDGLAGAQADEQLLKIKRLRGVIAGTVLLIVIVTGGKLWWDSWASNYKRFLYKPYQATSRVVQEGMRAKLEFKIDTAQLPSMRLTRNINFIIPDHGKLMHMFLVRAGSMDAFAHPHPRRTDSVTFQTWLPPLPDGTYWIFADITRASGFSETIPDTLVIEKGNTPFQLVSLDSLLLDRDDTYYMTNAINESAPLQGNDVIVCGKPGIKTVLPDGSGIVWEEARDQQFIAGKLYSLTFSITDPDGAPANLEPYLGMMGHAVVMKTDGSAYIHLHPVGSYSSGSQQAMLNRFEKEVGLVNADRMMSRGQAFRDSIDQVMQQLEQLPPATRDSILMAGMEHPQLDPDHPDHSVITFPYVFPSAGNYRIWIQTKRAGKIMNSAFDVAVAE